MGIGFFAVAMGYMESAVVVYLRELYYQEGFHIITAESLMAVPNHILLTEAGRELATIVILVSVSVLVARRDWLKRCGYFLFAFSVWDIAYYVWLFVLIRWPESLLANDVLFLIPRPWLGPVIAPILISASLIFVSLLMLSSTKEIVSFTELAKMWRYWIYIVVGIWAIVSAFILWEHRIFYLWNNVAMGLFIGIFTVIVALKRAKR